MKSNPHEFDLRWSCLVTEIVGDDNGRIIEYRFGVDGTSLEFLDVLREGKTVDAEGHGWARWCFANLH